MNIIKNILTPLYRKYTGVYWNLAFVRHTYPLFQDSNFHEVPLEKNAKSWFADPFIFKKDNQSITLLVEEFLMDKHKGVISKLVYDSQTLKLKRKKIVLELATHLSFPYYYYDNNKCFVFPENSASGCLTSYIYDDDKEEMIFNNVSVDEPLTDISILKIKNIYYLFGTAHPFENSNRLRVFRSSSLNDKFEFYSEYILNPYTARGAGDFISLDETFLFIRLAQENKTIYGKGLVVQRVEFDENSMQFLISEENIYYPHFGNGIIAMHTYNVLGDTAVIDVKRYRYPFIGRIINFIRYNLLK